MDTEASEQSFLLPLDEGQSPSRKPRDKSKRRASLAFVEDTLSSTLDSLVNRNLSHSDRHRIADIQEIGAAAFLIRDAVLFEVENPAAGAYDPYADPAAKLRNSISILCRRYCSYRPFRMTMYGVSWMLVLLTFFEPPHWCRSHDPNDQLDVEAELKCFQVFDLRGTPAGSDSSAESVLLYPNWEALFITVPDSEKVEAIGVLILCIFFGMRIGRDGMSLHRYLRPSHVQYSRMVQLVALPTLILGLATGYTHHHPYARLAILLSLSPLTQRELEVVINMLPEVLNILAILGVLMLFYAWFGTVMFVGTEEGKEHFSSLIESLWTLWICVTTANYPDVMMSAYNRSPWTSLYFVSFMVVSFFFLMNLVLAAVFDEYQTAFQQRKDERASDTERDLRKAFGLLDPLQSGGIPRETIMSLFHILNDDFPEFRTLSEDDTKLLFAFLDKDGSSAITEEEFLDFGSVLLLDFVKTSEYATLVERRFPRIFVSEYYQRFCKAIKSSWFEYAVDVVLVMNAVVIFIQSYPELAGHQVSLDPQYWDGSIDTVWEEIEAIFTIIYSVEVMLKLLVMGRRRYFESVKNVFDFSITTLAIASTVYVYYPNEFSDSRLIKMVVMLRALRLFRLITAMKRFQLIGTISGRILPPATNVFMLLFSMMYMFAVVGMQLFGGLVTRDPSNPLSYLILNTAFSDNDYWANNFNDMFSAMNVVFNLLVVNNWTECEAGLEATTESKWVRLYFFAFHICAVVLVNNLVIAFVMNAFFQELAILKEKTETEVVGDGEAVLQDRTALFDASEVTGTKTSLSGGYIARLRHTYSDMEHEQERLKKLFTTGSTRSFTNGYSDR